MSIRSSKTFKVVLFLALATSVFAVHRWWTAKNYAADQPVATPEALLGELDETLTQLVAADGVATPESPDATCEMICTVDRVCEQLLAGNPDLNSQEVQLARMSQVKAYFLAAQRQRDAYNKRFETLSTQLMQDYPGSTAAVEVSILRFASQHDLTKPLDDETFQALTQQASGFANQRNGVALYSFVSHQLYTNGQVKSAKAVLDAGTTQYRGQPGWDHLFEQKFQQGHLKVPKPNGAGGVFGASAVGGGAPSNKRT